jgi:hypothetical protein
MQFEIKDISYHKSSYEISPAEAAALYGACFYCLPRCEHAAASIFDRVLAFFDVLLAPATLAVEPDAVFGMAPANQASGKPAGKEAISSS